ncbi:SigE family RNA polymerase sigma factor [Acidothermaceae bacterium B102]|nr:SigE family RNA polymerase sigma factor [Acidothermaceae bacterium B102]
MAMRRTDQAEFEAFVSARSPALRRTAFLVCGDWHQAEDVVQNALTKLYLAWGRVERRDGVDAYARQIVVRCALDERRRGWRRERPVDAVPDRATAAADESGDREALLAALAAVPRRQRAVLVLRYWDDVSVAETGRVLGISEGSVKSAASRGLDNLRRALPELTFDSREGG